MHDIPFHELMRALLQQFALPTVHVSPSQEVYTLHFDGQADVHLVSKVGSRHVDVMTEATRLSNVKAAAALLSLHELNGCGVSDPAVKVTVDRASGHVIVWGRLSGQMLNLAALTGLLQQVQQQAEKARQALERTERPLRNQTGTAARLMPFLRQPGYFT